MSEEEKFDFSELFIDKKHCCMLCERVLPHIRAWKNLFYCDECNEFRKQFSDSITIKELQEKYNRKLEKKLKK